MGDDPERAALEAHVQSAAEKTFGDQTKASLWLRRPLLAEISSNNLKSCAAPGVWAPAENPEGVNDGQMPTALIGEPINGPITALSYTIR